MDLNSFAQALRAGLAQVPPVAIAVVLLAGPTVFLVAYRFVSVARRIQEPSGVELTRLWVCHSCRSVNELRQERCYRCGSGRSVAGKIEIVVDRPGVPIRPFEVPAGSPFAAVATGAQQRDPVPVMGQSAAPSQQVAVGPGRDARTMTPAPDEEHAGLVEAER